MPKDENKKLREEVDELERLRKKDKGSKDRVKQPLQQRPLYKDQRHITAVAEETSKKVLADLLLRRVFFINQAGEHLLPFSAGVDEGGKPKRFRGKMERIPIIGEELATQDLSRRFKVTNVRHILHKSPNRPESVYVVLEEVRQPG